jgi:hypothetical protein
MNRTALKTLIASAALAFPACDRQRDTPQAARPAPAPAATPRPVQPIVTASSAPAEPADTAVAVALAQHGISDLKPLSLTALEDFQCYVGKRGKEDAFFCGKAVEKDGIKAVSVAAVTAGEGPHTLCLTGIIPESSLPIAARTQCYDSHTKEPMPFRP